MEITGKGKELRIFLGESDKWQNKSLYAAIVEKVKEEGLAGATVLRGIEGFGASSRIRTDRILRLSSDLPVVVIIVDREDRINRILPAIKSMMTGGMITLSDTEILRYAHEQER